MWIGKVAIRALLAKLDAREGELRLQIAGLQQEVERERTKVLMLERALAVSQANVDWMRVMANTMAQDRTKIAAFKGLDLPSPEIGGRLQTAADVERKAEKQAASGVPEEVGAAIAEAADFEEALDRYKGHVGNFEDVGD